jgi:hypothetical protein
VSDVEDSGGPTYVWRADGRYRLAGAAVMALLLLLSLRVVMIYGLGAIVGVALVVLLVAWTWWVLLRPRLTASPDGVEVVHGRSPVRLAWPEIRRCEPTADGLKISVRDGREVVARYPQQRVAPTAEPTEADATAAYLAQRAAWARKPTGPMPVYVPPPRPAKTVRA